MRACLLAGLAAFMFVPYPARAQDSTTAQAALQELETAEFRNFYLPFARHALGEAAKRERGGTPRSVILVQRVSMVDPKTMPCYEKPLAAIIDLDIAPGTPSEMDVEPQSGFAWLLDMMRDGGIRIAWLAEASEIRLQPAIALLSEGAEPVMRDDDLMLIDLPGAASKQERRWQLAQSHCVVAVAGDRKGDFDELYDYLRDESYAIRLEAFMDRGWFLLPHPVAAIDSERLAISPEQKADQ